MNCYIIAYDLHKKDSPEYKDLTNEIKSYKTYAHILESVWAIVTDDNAKEIRAKLKRHIVKKDSLFVVRSGVEAAWTDVICSNGWLKEHL